jgi:hypothetical protein
MAAVHNFPKRVTVKPDKRVSPVAHLQVSARIPVARTNVSTLVATAASTSRFPSRYIASIQEPSIRGSKHNASAACR